MVEEAAPTYKHFGVIADWRTFAEYFKRLEERTHPAINLAIFVGAGGVRKYVIGEDDRPATPPELERMKETRGRGHGAGRARREFVSAVHARPFRRHRRVRRPGRRRRPLRGRSTSPISARKGTTSSSPSKRFSRSPKRPTSRPRSGTSRPPIKPIGAKWRKSWPGSTTRGLEGSTSRPISTHTSGPPTASIPASRCGSVEGGVEKMLARLKDPTQRGRIKKEMDDPTVSPPGRTSGTGPAARTGIMVASVLNKDLKEVRRAEYGRDRQAARPGPARRRHGYRHRRQRTERLRHLDHGEEDMRTALKSPFVSICTDSEARAEDGPLSGSKSIPGPGVRSRAFWENTSAMKRSCGSRRRSGR